ncbi:hypothetical protein [Blastopirellula marina]|uniref:Uncharacterized protein n=1 Tax=Blastopirellula marina TaxID=124 RepID=A0A2S8FTF6_9BACT|nr:hypothetical protein [Blastopirellula marina]PQO35463.1 hypothetical protein C5Y98_13965 [Blastopirellula marina]PTL44103.1 hypothetical protein C5Y97_13975 [Blastopirellula marina]
MQKLDLQNGGMKSKLILHVEKIVFAVAVLLVVTFIYFGAQREGISVTPDQVKQEADRANANINNSEWSPVEKKRWTEPVFEQRAELAQNPISINSYAALSEFGPPMYQSIQKRTDPKILTVDKLEAKSGWAPFVYDDKRLGGLGGGPGAMMEPGGYGPPGGYGGEGYLGGMEYGGPGGRQQKDMPPVMSPEQQKRFGPARATAGTRIEGRHFVVLTALVPLEKQWDEYDAALLDAAGYNEQRDVPKYIGFGVRRRQLLPDGTWSEYKDLVPQMAFADAMKWAFRPEEVVSPEYVHPLLTFPIAPMLLVDPADYARHSEVPKWIPTMQGGMMGEGAYPGMGMGMTSYGTGMEGAEGAMPAAKMPEFTADSVFMPGLMGGQNGMGMGMGMEGGMGMMPGMGMGMEGAYPGPGGSGMIGGRPGRRGGRGGMNGGMPGGMPGGMYEGGGGMMGGAAGYSKEKMFRFYDTTVKPNTEYQYQVNLWLEDPNNPALPQGMANQGGGGPGMGAGQGLAPSSVTLSREVLSRIALKKQEAGKDPVKLRKASRLETEYSQPSPVVKTTLESSVIAGGVRAGREQRSADDRLLNSRDAQATVLGVTWDEAEGTLSSKKMTVERGDSVNTVEDMWVLNPGTLMFDKKEDYDLHTNSVVLDIRGGEGLPGRYRDPAENEALVSLGEILVMDEKGNIKIHKELKDRKDFSLFDFTPPEVKKTSGSGGDEPYGAYGEGPPDMEGGSRRRGRMRE